MSVIAILRHLCLSLRRGYNDSMKSLLKGISQTLMVVATLLFLFGGRAISELAKMERVGAEVIGIGLAVVLGILAFIAKSAADNLDAKDSSAQ
jgi:Na+/H+ antiporter NhaC